MLMLKGSVLAFVVLFAGCVFSGGFHVQTCDGSQAKQGSVFKDREP